MPPDKLLAQEAYKDRPRLHTSVHGIGELDENRVFLHDSLDVLPTDTNDPLVVLVWNMERNRRRHLLLDEGEALFHRFVRGSHDVDVEVVLVEAIKDDLDVALAHNLVDFAIFFAADELLVLIGQLDLDPNLILGLDQEFHIRDHSKSRLDGIIGASHSKVQLIKRQIGIRVGTNITEHGSDIGRVGKLPGLWLLDEPSSAVELTCLQVGVSEVVGWPLENRLTKDMISRTVRSTWRPSLPWTLTMLR